jgi:signal transduction histidine kinase
LLSREVDETKPGDDPPQLPPPREDEIGTLQKSFHRLLKRVKEDEKEKERTQRNLLLTEKMVAIGKLTSGVAHEINNPLGGLLNCVYHFKRGGLPPERQTEYLYLMEDGIKRIQNTVTNLLEFARTPKLERTTTDVVSLIERALSLLDYQLRKSRIEVTKDISLNLPSIEVDRNQMGQVFVNIFLNAIQAMEESGVLKIGAKTLDDRVIMTISDTGKGIPKTILPKVFDPFFTTKGEGRGTGLGLWISQGIVERHGGTIQITSLEPMGTTVEIQLLHHPNRRG